MSNENSQLETLMKELEDMERLYNHSKRNSDQIIRTLRSRVDMLTAQLEQERSQSSVWECTSCANSFFGPTPTSLKERKCPSCTNGILLSLKHKAAKVAA